MAVEVITPAPTILKASGEHGIYIAEFTFGLNDIPTDNPDACYAAARALLDAAGYYIDKAEEVLR